MPQNGRNVSMQLVVGRSPAQQPERCTVMATESQVTPTLPRISQRQYSRVESHLIHIARRGTWVYHIWPDTMHHSIAESRAPEHRHKQSPHQCNWACSLAQGESDFFKLNGNQWFCGWQTCRWERKNVQIMTNKSACSRRLCYNWAVLNAVHHKHCHTKLSGDEQFLTCSSNMYSAEKKYCPCAEREFEML